MRCYCTLSTHNPFLGRNYKQERQERPVTASVVASFSLIFSIVVSFLQEPVIHQRLYSLFL